MTRRVLVAGPPPHLSGGIATVTRVLMEAAESGACGDWEVLALDSGGGQGAFGYKAFPAAILTVLRTDADVLHLHMATVGSALRKVILSEAARWRGLPYVIHLHGATFDAFADSLTPIRRSRLARAYRGAGGIVVLGEYWRDVVSQKLGVPAESVTVVANGVPDVGLDAGAREAAKPLTILFVGELTRRKGVDVLLEALTSVLPDRPDWRVLLCGPTPEADLLGDVARLGEELGGRVQATGNLAPVDRDNAYHTSHIVCLPSRAEGLPMVLLEAMSAGLPCVTTSVGSIADAVDDSVGALLPPGEPAALARALAELMDDPALRSRKGQAARARWQDGFSHDVMARRLSEVWEQAAAVPALGPEGAGLRDTGPGPSARHTAATPVVSVVIPTVGRDTLTRAVASVRAQGVPVEVIIVDDSGTGLAAEAIPEGVRHVQTTGHEGAAAARNLGMQTATGEVIAFLDDDDTWRPGHLLDALAVFERRPDVSIYASRGLVTYPDGRERVEPVELLGGRSVAEYFYGPSVWSSRCRRIMTPTLVFRRKVAAVPMDTTLGSREDTWWLLSAERRGAVVHQSAHVGVDVTASPARDRIRAQSPEILDWEARVDGLDPQWGTGYLVGSVARSHAQAGRPVQVIRTALRVLRRAGGARWMPVLVAQTGAASVVALARLTRRRREE